MTILEDMEVAAEDVPSLKAEIERLSRELDEASSDKIQSAQYGLALLEEKEALSKRCDELEAAYENSKHDLIITSEVGMLMTICRFIGPYNILCLIHHINLQSNSFYIKKLSS